MVYDRIKIDLFQSSFMKNQKQNGGQEPKSPKTKLRLPKLQIAKFSGNLKEWLPFCSQFRKIHEDDSMDSECKFVYLLQSIEPGTETRLASGKLPVNSRKLSHSYRTLEISICKRRYSNTTICKGAA